MILIVFNSVNKEIIELLIQRRELLYSTDFIGGYSYLILSGYNNFNGVERE
jgi:hypothetical protein